MRSRRSFNVFPCRWIGLVSTLAVAVLAEPDSKKTVRVEDPQGGWVRVEDDLTLRYFDADGNAVWGPEGIRLASYARPVLRAARFNRSHALVVLWKEPSAGGELWRAQAVDASGQRLWSEEGLVLHEPTTDAASVAAILDEEGRVLLAWEEMETRPTRIHIQRWDPAGRPEWGNGGRVSTIQESEPSPEWKLSAARQKVFIVTPLQAVRVF